MTYKGSNWTRGELGNVPDRNPHVPCHVCSESYLWQNYWKPRYVEPDNADPMNEPFVCDECIEQAQEEYDLAKKERSHKSLQEFA